MWARLLVLGMALATLTSVTGCWWNSSRVPEECKVTTDPEACRRQYQRR